MAEILFKGSKGGGSGTFKQTPDNLRSDDTFEGVLGVGIGPMKGPKRGLKSIKLDGTAVENETGELNFGDFIATVGTGDPTAFPQPIQLKLGGGGSPVQVGLTLTNPNGTGGQWVTRTLNNTNADSIDLRFVVSQLYRQDKKGIYAATATLEIQMKPVGSLTWINPTLNTPSSNYSETGMSVPGLFGSIAKIYFPEGYFNGSNGNRTNWAATSPNYSITGKTNSPSVYELRLGVPNTGAYANVAWDIRVRLLETDSLEADPNFEKRTIQWESMNAIYSTVLGTHEDWRGVAWLQLYGKASNQLTGVPEVTGVWDTKIVSVPASNVYNADTRQYTGALWDGSFAKAFTNDPAWVINDAISDSLSGLSLIASGSYLNKWDALEVSKWCSVQVPDGNGGTHPRYSMNLSISEPQKAEEFIRFLSGAVGGLAWDQGDGQWRIKVDKPEAPVDLFTLENIEGEFLWSNTDTDTRYNDITGTFKNEEMDFRQDRVRLFDNVSIAKIGRKPITIALVGCTNRQEALRRVMLRLRSTTNEKRVVNFTTNRRGRNINQLDTILIADADMADADKRTTGRMSRDGSNVKVVFRDPVYLPSGATYYINQTNVNPNYSPESETQPVDGNYTKPTLVNQGSKLSTNAANFNQSVTTLYIDPTTPLPADMPNDTPFAISASNLPAMPKLFRVTNVVLDDDGEHISISALEVDTGKWDASDNVTNQATVFEDLRGPSPIPLPPENGQILTLVKVPVEQGFQVNLVANWIRPVGAFISGFKVSYSINGGAWQTPQERSQSTTFELVNPTPGAYEFKIQTIDRRGSISEALYASMEVTQDLLNAADIYYVNGQGVATVPVNSLKPAEAGANVTETRTSLDTTNVAGRPSSTLLAQVDNTVPLLSSTPPGVPTGLSLTSVLKIDNTGQQVINLVVSWNPVTGSTTPLAGYTLALKETVAGNFVEVELGKTATKYERIVIANTVYVGKVRSVDNNGNVSSFSAEVSTTSTVDTVPPAAPTGLVTATSISSAFLSWTNPADADLATIEVWEATVNNSASATKLATVNGERNQKGAFTRTGLTPNTTYYYWLKAVDASGNTSGFNTAATAGTTVLVRTIAAPDFAAGLAPISIVTSLPSPSGYTGPRIVFNDTDKKVYRYNGTAFVTSVATTDLSGTISDAQMTALSASKITGTLTDAQIAGIAAAKLTGQITQTQITDNAISTAKLAAGAVTAATIAADTITAAQIAASAITSTELAAGAVTAGKILAGTIVALDIAAGTITGDRLLAGTIQAAQIAAGAIVASKLFVGDTANMVPDSTLVDPASWTGATFTLNVGDPGYVGQYLRLPVSASQQSAFSRPFPVEGNKPYFVSGIAVGNGGSTASVLVLWYSDSAGASSISQATVGSSTGSYNGTRLSTQSLAPGNAKSARIVWQRAAGGSTPSDYAEPIVRRATTGELIVDGTITALKIAVGAITADRIQAGTLTGDRFNTGTSLPGTITIGTLGVQISTVASTAMNTVATKLTPIGTGTVVTGNTVSKTTGTHGLYEGGAVAAPQSGSALITTSILSPVTGGGWHTTLGLDTDPTNINPQGPGVYANVTISTQAGGTALLYPSWGGSYSVSGLTTASRFGIGYDGKSIYAIVNGVKYGSLAIPPNLTFYPKVFNYFLDGAYVLDGVVGIVDVQSGINVDNSLANADPAGRINAFTTQIDPGKILISGSTTLASWRNGADVTKIEGGSIAANTITANKLKIGSRGVSFQDLVFQTVNGNTCTWGAGGAFYTDDNGNQTVVGVSAGSCPTAPGFYQYIYWQKGSGVLQYNTNWQVATAPDCVHVATYTGGTNVVQMYGGTIIDGSNITTGTITAVKLNVATLSAISANIGLLRTASSGARTEIESNVIRVYDVNGTLRVRMGLW